MLKKPLRTVIAAGVLSTLAFAQDVRILPAAPDKPAVNPESMYGKESAQGVYVRDSAVALEKFAQAQRMERLKEWDKAADLYQEVLEKFADRVVPSQVDKDNSIYQYISVIAAVQQKMSRWPQEGLEVYRQRYEAAAQSIMESAKIDDRTAMQQVLNRYFPTETAKAAGMRLMDLYLESGEFAAAAWMGEQLLSGHPNLIVERPRVLYRCALAYHLAGDAERSRAKVEQLRSKYADATGTVRGVDVKLVDSIAHEIAQGAPRQQAIADSSWPMFGGSVDHARISTAAGKPGAKLYSVELTKPNFSSPTRNDQLEQLKNLDRQDEESGATLGVMPVIDRGELFFQDGVRLYGVSVDSGSPLPGWLTTYGTERKGQYQLPGAGRYVPRGQLATVTLTDSSVLAIMGQSDRRAIQFGFSPPAQGDGRLVCLDRATGKEKWVMHPRNLPEEASALRTCDLTGSPLVVDNNVYIAARSGKGNQFEDCHVLCFELDSGKFKWSCYVASANSIGNAMMMDGELTNVADTTPQLAYSSGRLYVLTNLGALAAVDAYGGRIVWLSIYPRDPALVANAGLGGRRFAMGGMAAAGMGEKPWQCNPVFIDNGRVFVLPSDGRFVHVYDAGAGTEVKRIDVKHFGQPPGDTGANSLIAVDGPRMLMTSTKMAIYLNWEKYNLDTFVPRPKNDPSIEGIKNLPAPVRGRSFVAGGYAYVPTTEKIYVIQLKSVKVIQEYPQYPKNWDREESEGPGNVLVSDDHVIIAANRRVDVYTDMDAARRKLDAEIAQAPQSAEPRLKYAEVMFVSGHTPEAMEKLDEAIELLGGLQHMRPGSSRDRVFGTCITNAQKLGRDIKDTGHENFQTVQGLYARAAAAAGHSQQQVRVRMLRAELASTVGDEPLAVKLYQEIIARPQWRAEPTLDEQSNVQSASGLVARKAIDHIIRTRGAMAYKPFDDQAAAAFDAAHAAHDADALVSVATVYPNAKAAPLALLAAADVREAAHDARGAVQLLRQLYLTYPNAPDKRRVLESMARNYLAIPNRTGVAVARLAEAAKLGGGEPLGKPLTLPDGQTIENLTLNQAVEALKKLRGQEVTRTLPDFRLPVPPMVQTPQGPKRREPFLPETPDMVMAEVQQLLVPAKPFQRFDRVVTFSRGAVNVFAAGQTKPLATLAMSEAPAGLAWTAAGPLVWSPTVARQLRGDSSDVAWTFDTRQLVSLEVVASVPTEGDNADEDTGADAGNGGQVHVDPGMGRRVIINNRRRMIVVNGRLRELPNEPLADKANIGGAETIRSARPVGEVVLFTTSSGRLVAVDVADGKTRWQTRLGERLPQRIVANEEFTVIYQREDVTATLTVLDTFSGQPVGRRFFGDGGRVPFNFALSPDGTLVYALSDVIVLKNLYEPWTAADREITVKPGQQQNVFAGSTAPDALQVVDGRVLIVSDNGTMLRVFSMETAKPLQYKRLDGERNIDMVLPTTARNGPVTLRVIGSQAYLIGRQTLIAYNLDQPGQSWRMYTRDSDSQEEILDSFIGRQHLVLLKDTRKRVNAGKVAAFRLQGHARYPISATDSAEAGRMDYDPIIRDPAGITRQWQAVEGGFCYLAEDQKLHFLKSAGGAN